MSEHTWVPLKPGSKFYRCKHCPVTGLQVGRAWPPLRSGRFVMPENKTCEGATRTAVQADLQKRGIVMDELGEEPRPYTKPWLREKLGVSGDVDE